MPKIRDLAGQKFNNVSVISFVEMRKHRAYWLCQCSCGETFITEGHNLSQGNTKSCGCIRHAKLVLRNSLGQPHPNAVTRMSEYRSFWHAYDRCTRRKNRAYENYGGRGIKFLYISFSQFLSDVGKKPTEKHSLDRINMNGNYEFGNCRWATSKEQANNRRPRCIQRLHEDLLVAYAQEVMGAYDTGIR